MNKEPQKDYIDFYLILYPDHIGKENAITSGALMEKLGITDKRVFHKELEKARQHGQIICTSTYNKGYFIADTDEEIKDFICVNVKRCISTFKIIKSAREWLKIREEYENGVHQINIDEILLNAFTEVETGSETNADRTKDDY